jgi:hypothetical protein
MKIEYNLSKEDWINFNMYHSRNSKTNKMWILTLRLFIFVMLLILNGLVLFSFFFTSKEFGLLEIAFPIVVDSVGILYIIFLQKLASSRVRRVIKKMIEEGKNEFLGKQSIEINDEFLLRKTKVSEMTVHWLGIERIAQDDKYVFIYDSALSAFIVPKKAFKNKKEMDLFFKKIEEKITIGEKD